MALWRDIHAWNVHVDRRGKRLVRRKNLFAVRVGGWEANDNLVALGIGRPDGSDFAGITLEREQAIEVAKLLFEFAGVDAEEF